MNRQQLIQSYQQQFHAKVLEITQLSMEVSIREIAHAGVYFHGHVNRVDACVRPTDTCYQDVNQAWEELGRVNVPLYFYEWMDEEEITRDCDKRLQELDEHIALLNGLLANANAPAEEITEATV